MSASVFPAPAGMSRTLLSLTVGFRCFPRTCGDEPKIDKYMAKDPEFSPHLRG